MSWEQRIYLVLGVGWGMWVVAMVSGAHWVFLVALGFWLLALGMSFMNRRY